jgi:hypothetical protein
MILNALAAKPFARARLVGTIAVGPVVYFLAFHPFLLSLGAYPFILGELGRIGQGDSAIYHKLSGKEVICLGF